MRVLHFLPVYAPAWHFGGPVLSVSRLCEALVTKGAEVRVITTTAGLPDFPKEDLGKTKNLNGVNVIYYPTDKSKRTNSSQLIQSLPEHIEWADIIHISSIWQPLGIYVQKCALKSGKPLIQTLRGALGPYSLRHKWWIKIPYLFLFERPLLQKVASIHCTSNQELREISWLRLKPRADIIPNPVDLNSLRNSNKHRAEWREHLSIHKDEPLMLVVGRFHHKKGLDFLPPVLNSLLHKPWRILFIGDEEDGSKHRLRKSLASTEVSTRCLWMDSLPSTTLIGPYNAADYLLMPSRHENFGNVVVEALACGCGVMMSDNVGISNELTQCPGAFSQSLVTSDWVTLLDSLLSNPRPGHASEKWVKENFSSSVVADMALNLYSRILNYGD